jgi:hypothetical protein
VERRENYDTRFFLALHNAHDPYKTDYISGARLATALRPSQRPDSSGLAKPVVVTLASCDSGNVGSVAGAGSSIAHALHESGIPMVVAGQFPLSFAGSVCLVDCLYSGLLWGTDPRPLLYDLRRRLFSQFQDKHDWASLTAYVSLPPDFEQQLSTVQIDQAMRSINASMNHADEATRKLIYKARLQRSTPEPETKIEDLKSLLLSSREKINDSKQKLERLLTRQPAEKVQIYGFLASTEKRQAEVLYSTNQSSWIDAKIREQDRKDSIEYLRKSRDHYWDTFLLDRSRSWALVQYLSLSLVMNHSLQFDTKQTLPPPVALNGDRPERKLPDLWAMAKLLSLYDLRSTERKRIIWAYSNLVELYLLSLIMLPDNDLPPLPEAQQRALEYADALVDFAGRNAFEVYSTRRQILRYLEWFNNISNIAPLIGLAEQIFERFPEDVEEAWK